MNFRSFVGSFFLIFCLSISTVFGQTTTVNLCNSYTDSTKTITWTWGTKTTNPVKYHTCITDTFNSTILSGTASLWNGDGTLNSTLPATISALCTDGNRNILIGYSNQTNFATTSVPLPNGCASVPTTYISLVAMNLDCSLPAAIDVYFVSTGGTSSNVKLNTNGIPCGSGAALVIPPFTAVPGTTTVLQIYTTGSTTNSLGNFDVSHSGLPNPPGTEVFFLTGDANNPLSVFYVDSAPAGAAVSGAMETRNPVYAIIIATIIMVTINVMKKF